MEDKTTMTETQLTPDGRVVVRIPLKIKRMAGRKEVIPPPGTAFGERVGESGTLGGILPELAQESVVVAIARAYRWKDLLESGQVPSITALARKFKVDGSYVGRILRLSLLAPDIVDAIIEGREPDELSLRKLRATFPLDWREQRRFFGFEQRSKTTSSQAL
jgi:hypothetical protein